MWKSKESMRIVKASENQEQEEQVHPIGHKDLF